MSETEGFFNVDSAEMRLTGKPKVFLNEEAGRTVTVSAVGTHYFISMVEVTTDYSHAMDLAKRLQTCRTKTSRRVK